MIGQVMDLLFALLAPRYILADAAITLEDTGSVKHGLAAHANPYFLAGFVQPAELKVMERLASIENGHMRGPVDRGHVEVALFPARLADKIETEFLGPCRTGSGKRGEAVLVVLLPVQIR